MLADSDPPMMRTGLIMIPITGPESADAGQGAGYVPTPAGTPERHPDVAAQNHPAPTAAPTVTTPAWSAPLGPTQEPASLDPAGESTRLGPAQESASLDPPKEPRRPGWRGVAAVTIACALLASLVTLGVVKIVDDRTSSSTAAVAPNVAPVQQSAPLVTSSATVPDWKAVAAAVEPSVVAVEVQAGDGSGGEGSGVIFNSGGAVVTNNHVVADAGQSGSISVTLADGRIYPAKVVGTDPSTDLAVIKMQNAPSGLKVATFENAATAAVGDPVMSVGNPLGLSETVTTGIISALNRPVTTTTSSTSQPENPFFGGQQSQGQQVVTNAIQTDAAINPGNSGGALVDSSGRVIGVTSSIASLGQDALGSSGQSGSIGLGFAIPASEVTRVANELVSNGTVQHAYLGVTLSDGTTSVDGAQREAAVIGTVSSGTPAATAGLKSKDAVIALNSTSVDGADSLVAQVRALPPGTKITLTLIRDGKQLTVSLALAVGPPVASQ